LQQREEGRQLSRAKATGAPVAFCIELLRLRQQMIAATVPVPAWPGSPEYPGLVLMSSTPATSPEIVDPDWETELATMT